MPKADRKLSSKPQTDKDPAVLAAEAYAAASDRSTKADEMVDLRTGQADKRYPVIPESVRRTTPNGCFFLMSLYDAAKASSGVIDFERRAKLITEYEAKTRKIDHQFGIPTLKKKRDEAYSDERCLMKVLRDTRATTAAGMLTKLQIAIGMNEEGMAEVVAPDSLLVAPAMFSSVVADLKRLTGAK